MLLRAARAPAQVAWPRRAASPCRRPCKPLSFTSGFLNSLRSHQIRLPWAPAKLRCQAEWPAVRQDAIFWAKLQVHPNRVQTDTALASERTSSSQLHASMYSRCWVHACQLSTVDSYGISKCCITTAASQVVLPARILQPAAYPAACRRKQCGCVRQFFPAKIL